MYSWWHRFKVLKNTLLIIFTLMVILLFFSFGKIYPRNKSVYGITFSPKHAASLGLNWQEVFEKANDELKIKNWRLSAYWDEVEPINNQFNWEQTDWLLNESLRRENKVIFAVGARLPRWPECHIPLWAQNLTNAEREEKILNYIAQVVVRYKDNPSIVAWQVENEPFLSNFGICPDLNSDFLDQEIALVRKLVPDKPIVVTDSGELSIWVPAAKRADIFGTTMYRDTYSSALQSYIHYPITPAFFRAKRNLTSLFAKPKDWIVIELQAEPWARMPYQDVTQAERDKTMSPQKFTEMMEFAQKTGFKEFYLWGLEWWYWEKVKNNRPDFWNEAKNIFKI